MRMTRRVVHFGNFRFEEKTMFRNVLAFAIVMISVSLLTVPPAVNAQSGSRNSVGLSRNGLGSRSSYRPAQQRRSLTAQELAVLQQQAAEQQQTIIAAQRKQALQQVTNNPNSQLNKTQFLAAFKDAKAEFMAIHNGRLGATGRNLNRIFVLRTRDFNRNAGNIKWPRALNAAPHKELTKHVDDIVSGKSEPTQLDAVLQQLNQQLERRVVAKSINIKDYANAKRFVSGLANEAML
jgi:hypothetical protein